MPTLYQLLDKVLVKARVSTPHSQAGEETPQRSDVSSQSARGASPQHETSRPSLSRDKTGSMSSRLSSNVFSNVPPTSSTPQMYRLPPKPSKQSTGLTASRRSSFLYRQASLATIYKAFPCGGARAS
eukprot:1238742-Prymnesium_polylepis.1